LGIFQDLAFQVQLSCGEIFIYLSILCKKRIVEAGNAGGCSIKIAFDVVQDSVALVVPSAVLTELG
jgi:hypothetical protein